MKRITYTFVSALFLIFLSLSGIAFAETSPVKVQVNGQMVVFPDVQPFVNGDNRTLVPIRFISEQLGSQVQYIPGYESVHIKKDDSLIVLKLGDNFAFVDGVKKVFDTKAELVNDRTMVPLRFISDALGAQVSWDESTQTVNIDTLSKPDTKLLPKVIKDALGYTIPVDPVNLEVEYQQIDDTLQPGVQYPEITFKITTNYSFEYYLGFEPGLGYMEKGLAALDTILRSKFSNETVDSIKSFLQENAGHNFFKAYTAGNKEIQVFGNQNNITIQVNNR